MSQQLNASFEEINSMVQTMSDNSERSTRNSTEILDGIKEATTSMEQVAATAENQAILAQKLQGLLNDFKI